ncbi:sugar nucleotide-binding protein [Nonomuraea sp. NBC_01738]|uniref:SDR family oxidoreductase n=1 Tax=Nonomuraea sp. NBC_01738 TaxID=2976003 RepID=UPI002E0E5BD1|nr:sugar nucleotide-binding protein [Nonomuraea sp. NBC_01738]
MRILIIGGSGHLGQELIRQAQAAGHHVTATYFHHPGTSPTRLQLDLRDQARTAALITSQAPDLVINAAYRQSDWHTTATGPANLALATRHTRLIHVSSDTVFSGTASPYTEAAPPDPITPYGAAKAAAETAVAAIHPEAVIARTSLILGRGSPHEARIHAHAAGTAHGTLFTDDVRCPVHVTDLARALLELTAPGVHHLAGPDPISRYDLALLVARRDGLDPGRLIPGLRDVPGPKDLRLDSTATQRRLTTRLRGAGEFLSEQD